MNTYCWPDNLLRILGWESQKWGKPSISERSRPNKVILTLPMVALSEDKVALSEDKVALSGGNVALSGGNEALPGGNVTLSGGNVALSRGNVALKKGTRSRIYAAGSFLSVQNGRQ